jgi:hypothetical protein
MRRRQSWTGTAAPPPAHPEKPVAGRAVPAYTRGAIARSALAGLLLLWAGVLIGVSFLAAPAKFNAPSLSLPVAMDVGRQEFGVLNLVEIGLAIVTLALAAYVRSRRLIWLALAIAALVVAVQALWLLPLLEARALSIIQGETPQPAPWHTLYIVLEVIKLLALLIAGWLALWRLRAA